MHTKTPHWIFMAFGIVVLLALLLTVVQQYGGKVESYRSRITSSRSIQTPYQSTIVRTTNTSSSSSSSPSAQPVTLSAQDQAVFSQIMSAAAKPFRR